MATGPQHYREAEYRLDQALNAEGGSNAERYDLAAAQIHATLALAAATALASTGVGEADLGEWSALICEPDDVDEDYNKAPDEDGDESHFTRAQMEGEACTVCGVDFAEDQPTVPSGYDFIEGPLFAHAACVKSEAGR